VLLLSDRDFNCPSLGHLEKDDEGRCGVAPKLPTLSPSHHCSCRCIIARPSRPWPEHMLHRQQAIRV